MLMWICSQADGLRGGLVRGWVMRRGESIEGWWYVAWDWKIKVEEREMRKWLGSRIYTGGLRGMGGIVVVVVV